MSEIHWLGDDDCHHEAAVGGKAASLSRLASRHTVPPGFAIAAVPASGNGAVQTLAGTIEAAYGGWRTTADRASRRWRCDRRRWTRTERTRRSPDSTTRT